MSAIEVRNLSKNYPLSGSQTARLWRVFKPAAEIGDGLWALRDVSFTVERGEAIGIIGANGSGKSTLLQIVAGILRPTSGSVEVLGRLSALLELGSGFSPEFTGRDNVYLNASVLGLSRGEIDDRFQAIERFAEIGDFIDQPIRTYSTGMVLRLAFAVAANVDPEILIVDEALAVGDIAFRQRCMHRIHDLRARGTTILFVSHETSDVKALCERCVWLENGVMRLLGEADAVVGKYLSATLRRETAHRREHIPSPQVPAPAMVTDAVIDADVVIDADAVIDAAGRHRFGDGRVSIIRAGLVSEAGSPIRQVTPHTRVIFKVRFQVHSPVASLIAGFLVRNARGENIFGSNTARENIPVPDMTVGETHTVDFHWTVPDLLPGSYTVSPGLADGNAEHYEMCDYLEDAVGIAIGGASDIRGYFRLPCAAVAISAAGTSAGVPVR